MMYHKDMVHFRPQHHPSEITKAKSKNAPQPQEKKGAYFMTIPEQMTYLPHPFNFHALDNA